jgi:arabinogalactan oligomer/maltooligosaccharide transport system substrate-binding protein
MPHESKHSSKLRRLLKMKKVMFSLMLVAVLVAALGAFSAQAQEVSLTYWDTMNDQERPVMQGIIDACAEELGYSVSVEYVPFADAQNKYRTAAQAGNAPDILRTEIAWGPEFAALGFLAELSEFVTEEEIAQYLAAPFAYNTWGGGIWGLPQVTDAPALMYNKELLAEAGYDAPPATMEELKEVALAVAANGKKGIMPPAGAYFFQPFMWAFGGGLIDAETLEILIDSQGTYDAFAYLQDLIDSGAMDANFDAPNQYTNNMNAFKEGNAAMIINGPWATSDVLSGPAFADPDNLGIAPIPAGPAGQGSPVGGHGYTIYAGSPFVPEALELIRCLNRPENQATLAKELNLIPTVIAAYEDPELAENDILQGFLAQMEVATARPVIPAGGQIYTEFDPQFQAVILGNASPEDAMSKVAAAWKALLEAQPQLPE